jgi:hypothetical protein
VLRPAARHRSLSPAASRSRSAVPLLPPESPPTATPAGFSTNPYCPPGQVLCSTLPGDDILVPPGCLSSDQQCSRDFWSWQGFVSLNWPGRIVNAPEGVQIVEPDTRKTPGDGGRRVWELWMDPDAVFLPKAVKPQWIPGKSPPLPCNPGEGRALVGRLAKASVAFDHIDPPTTSSGPPSSSR